MVKTRFCPSPTGLMHLGNARTALFNFLYAQLEDGVWLLRIEDTDIERSKPEYDMALQHDLHWLGLDWQEGPQADHGHGPYHQAKRQSVYDDYYTRLQAAGMAYPCFCSPEELALARRLQRAAGKPPRYAGTCRTLSEDAVQTKLAQGLQPTLRFRVPENETITFTDLVRGEQIFHSNDIGDFIIRRANGTSPFMFCNALDDALMGVTHVLRGEDHLTNTPRQIMILNALCLSVPHYGHIALIIAADGSPLSKRSGSRAISELRAAGYLPMAIVNYLARLGHHYDNDQFMSLTELAQRFKLAALAKSPAKFDLQQLNFWQKQAVERLTPEALWEWVGNDSQVKIPAEKALRFVAMVKPNIQFPQDFNAWIAICFGNEFILDDAHHALLRAAGHQYFTAALHAYEHYGDDFTRMTEQLQAELKLSGKALFKPLRVALTGLTYGPELAKLLALLEPGQIKKRLQHAKNL